MGVNDGGPEKGPCPHLRPGSKPACPAEVACSCRREAERHREQNVKNRNRRLAVLEQRDGLHAERGESGKPAQETDREELTSGAAWKIKPFACRKASDQPNQE